ncbi:GNAT family N-acetyltransferase [Methylocapsa aurea]|uniref:GNAT family N-acetyltransferase n=1 Tax=Methylocapsa aurea TaxID=663610 RepID=UPI00069018BD|nr:N-acetyltransferase [Methylocapsa aurea]
MTFILNEIAMQAPFFIGLAGEPDIRVAEETPADVGARENLLDAAFGPARREKTAERLREGRLPAQGLALVMKDSEQLVGTLRMWKILAGETPALLLGPLAIASAYRSRGLGRRLTAEALFRAVAAGHNAILLVGDAPYYEPFGFSRRHTLGLSLPGPVDEARFLGLEIKPGALKGAKGLVAAAGAHDWEAYGGSADYRRAA